jgi:MoaA/NifB/PqqE/SkfB family radical SAM enzyme
MEEQLAKKSIGQLFRLAKKCQVDKILPNRLLNLIGDKYYQRPKRPCHYKELFVQSTGDVYPCCRVWNRKDLRIGHITDVDIVNKIKAFNPRTCFCNKYSIRRAKASDIQKYEYLNLELSLACQAKCAQCSVGAPDWHGNYNYYDNIENLILNLGAIEKVGFQGGEILIQKKSIQFVENLRKKHLKNTRFHLITNGNTDAVSVERIERLFNSVTISIVGFQKETYRKIMGLDIDKTISLAETLIKRDVVEVSLKYLITPSNIHETNLFLNWALRQAPSTSIQIVEMGLYDNYINTKTSDEYWKKILERTTKDMHFELANADISKLRKNGTKIIVANMGKYQITGEFIKDNGL